MIVDVRRVLGRLHENTTANLVELQSVLTAARPVYYLDTIADRDAIHSSVLGDGDLAYVEDNGTGIAELFIRNGTSWDSILTGGATSILRYDSLKSTITASRTGIVSTFNTDTLTVSVPEFAELTQLTVREDAPYDTYYIDIVYAWDNNYNKVFANMLLNSFQVWDFSTFSINNKATLVSSDVSPIEVELIGDNNVRYTIHNLTFDSWQIVLR